MKFIYTGNGFAVGLPARDIYEEEAQRIGIARIRASGLYKEVKTTIKRAVEEIPPKEEKWQTE